MQPQAIVQAFAKLDAEQLMAPPEASRESFLDNLGIKGSSRAAAGELYDEMIQATAAADRDEKGAGSACALAAGSALAGGPALASPALAGPAKPGSGGATTQALRVSPENGGGQLQKTALAAPAKGSSPVPQAPAPLSAAVRPADLSTLALSSTAVAPAVAPSALGLADEPELSGTEAADSSEDASFAPSPAVDPDRAQVAIQPGPFRIGSADSRNPVPSSAPFKNPYASKTKTEAPAAAAKPVGAEPMALTTAPGAPPTPPLPAGSAAPASAAAGADASAIGSAAVQAPASAPGAVPGGAAGAAGGAFALGSRIIAKSDAEANVQEIVRQAQMIAKKGGGEMKMELRPEGLGQVNLRVSVQDGQVTVQMVTQTNDAKRLLESNWHELKSGLGAHKLQLEGLRIDAHESLQRQMDQGRSDSQREGARQQAGDFMGSLGGFREERESFRHAWAQAQADGASSRGYRGAPAISGAELALSARRSQPARRLNLVA